MQTQQEEIDNKFFIDLLGLMGAIGTIVLGSIGTLSWVYMQNVLNITSLKGLIDFDVVELTMAVSFEYILWFFCIGMVIFGTPWLLKKTLLDTSLSDCDKNYLQKLKIFIVILIPIYMVVLFCLVKDEGVSVVLTVIFLLITLFYVLWGISFKQEIFNKVICFLGAGLFIGMLYFFILMLWLIFVLISESIRYQVFIVLVMGALWLFYLLVLLNEKQQLRTLKEKMSFVSIFFLISVVLLNIGLGKEFGYLIYSRAGIIQTAKDTQTYQIRQSFFDKNITHKKLMKSLLENKNIVLSEGEKLNYFNQPIKAFLGWTKGDVVVLCEPRQGDKVILLNCESDDGLDLSKGLVINRQFLQRLSQ